MLAMNLLGLGLNVNFALLKDPHLILIAVVSAVVSMLTTVNVAARPAAVRSRQVATTFTIAQIFFMLTRFANMFYLPIMAHYVDVATLQHRVDVLYNQIQFIILGAAAGALMSWVLLPTFVEIYERAVRSMLVRQSMLSVLLRLRTPSGWGTLLGSLRPPGNLGIKLFKLEGVPVDFLLINIVSTAIWTVGALCAVYVSAELPQYKTTAILLSGLVNAVAAISFSVFVDPKAALITDRAVVPIRLLDGLPRGVITSLAGLDALGASLSLAPRYLLKRGKLTPAPRSGPRATDLFSLEDDPADRRVRITAVHLAAGNFLGGLLGLFFFSPGIAIIRSATLFLASQDLVRFVFALGAMNALFTLLATTTVASRVSAVLTRQVASALAIYNFFFLITRLAQQIYAPVLGSVSDSLSKMGPAGAPHLEALFRQILMGATVGAVLGWLLMPTFIEIYRHAILALDRYRSIPAMLLKLLDPRVWPTVLRCLRPPSLLGLNARAVRRIPKLFLIGNFLVISIYTVGVMAAVYASALDVHLARTATLLSSVVNGVATITLAVLVDPKVALITDDTIEGRRSMEEMNAMAVLLMGGTCLGTLFSQVLFVPAAHAILGAAWLVGKLFG